jgi:hypothetical protein
VAQVIRRHWLAGRIAGHRAGEALSDFQDLISGPSIPSLRTRSIPCSRRLVIRALRSRYLEEATALGVRDKRF